MPVKKASGKKQRRPARAKRSRAKGRTGRAPKPGESLLIDVARTVGTTLGALAARSSQAAERLRVKRGRKRS